MRKRGFEAYCYDVGDRRLVVNRPEAVTVKHIYDRYLELGSVRLLRNDLERREIVSKIRVSKIGVRSGDRQFSRGALYELLSNPIYPREGSAEIEEHKERLGTYGYAGQYQQRPVPEGGAIFKSSYFRLWQTRIATSNRPKTSG